MGLLDEIREEALPDERLCKVGRILEGMPKKDREDLQVAVDDPSINGEAIVRVMAKHGYLIGTTTFSKHRRKECCCGNR